MNATSCSSIGFLVIAVILLGAARATAEQPLPPQRMLIFCGHVDVALNVGYTPGKVSHPNFVHSQVHALMREMILGISFNEYFQLAGLITHFEMTVEDIGRDQYIRKKTGITPPVAGSKPSAGAPCTNCLPPTPGGNPIAGSLTTVFGGLHGEFSPMGRTGVFIGLAGGVGAIKLERRKLGGGLIVRTGYRRFISPKVALSLTVGLQSIFAETAAAWFPFAAGELRFRLI